jgi:peptidoglycan/LPS O-acetylase OafA/YrhL
VYQLAILVTGMLATVVVSSLIYARVERPSIALSRKVRRQRDNSRVQAAVGRQTPISSVQEAAPDASAISWRTPT